MVYMYDIYRYDIPPQWVRLIEAYYKGIFSKSFSESATGACHMNIIIEYSVQARVPKFTTNNTTLPLLLAFMDGLSLMSSTVSGAQTLFSWCITVQTWAGLEFGADKSCSLAIVKGRSMNTTPFLCRKHQTNQRFYLLFPPFTLDQSNLWVA